MEDPPITRAEPSGPIQTLECPAPVWAFIRWDDTRSSELPATAMAFTRNAVQVMWEAPGQGLRTDWLPSLYVRRFDGRSSRPVDPAAPAAQRRQVWPGQ